jgi:hypothetical protein
MERGLDAPEGDGVSHRRLDEVGQGLARLENRLEVSAQGRLDADLRDDGGLHDDSVLRLGYVGNSPSLRRAFIIAQTRYILDSVFA